MLKSKRFRIAALLGVTLLAVLTASAVIATSISKSDKSIYVGSTACLGCHLDQFEKWEGTRHATSVTQLLGPSDYPGDPSLAPEELKAELQKADFLWHGYSFMRQDPVTGQFVYLGVTWDRAKEVYVPNPRAGNVWDNNCGGCHSGAINASVSQRLVEPGIGCESCHGPGSAHIVGRGNPDLIVNTTLSSESCAQCHSGFNQTPGGLRWAKGYQPGTKIEEFPGFMIVEHNIAGGPPVIAGERHLEEYPQWKASAHATTPAYLTDGHEVRERCWNCHSTAVGIQVAKGEVTFDPSHIVFDGVGCAACHSTHGGTEYPAQLKMDPQALCVSCHSVGTSETKFIGTVRAPHAPQADMLQGTGAIGVAPTKGAHSNVTCIECHMTEKNHMMAVIKPGAVVGTDRVDSCTACHTNSYAASRDIYMSLWQESVGVRMEALKADVAYLNARIPSMNPEQKATYEAARANYWYVQKDNSKGAHNFEYTIRILNNARIDMGKLRAELPQ